MLLKLLVVPKPLFSNGEHHFDQGYPYENQFSCSGDREELSTCSWSSLTFPLFVLIQGDDDYITEILW